MASTDVTSDLTIRPQPVFDVEFRKRMAEIVDTISPSTPHLENVFNALLEGHQITLVMAEYRFILKDLGLTDEHLYKFDIPGFVQVLIYYVGCWPGWKNKQSTFRLFDEKRDIEAEVVPNAIVDDDIVYEGLDAATKKNWFKEFYAYLYLKITDVLKWEDVFNCFEKNNGATEHNREIQIQTEVMTLANRAVADYSIVIEAPPSSLNSIAFTTENGHIIIKKHVDKPWDSNNLTLTQFLNCPYVNVNIDIGDISFSRSNMHDFHRYISEVNSSLTINQSENIVSVKKMDAEAECSVYSQFYFQKYFEQFFKMLDAEKSLLQARKFEIKTIFKEFLSDIQEISTKNIPIATNTSIYFTMGDGKFIRSKQITPKGIHYLEILTPRILISLKHFRAEQDLGDKKRISFTTLNYFESKPEQFLRLLNSGCISYSCNLCHKVYSTYLHIGQHFNLEHRQEQDVICWRCKGTVNIFTLAGARWKHNCQNRC